MTPNFPCPTAREAFFAANAAVLARGRSVDLIHLRKYVFHVFRDDWIHNAIGQKNRDLTADEIRKRVANGTLVPPGKYGGDFDATDQALFMSFSKRLGPVTLADIGANYGHEGLRYSLLSREIGIPTKRHIAIEPAHAGLLLPANLLLHGLDDTQILSAAVAAEDCIKLFHFADNVTTGGTLTNNPASNRHDHVPTQVLKWDTIAKSLELSGPTFFKIDIQGAERFFLDGAADYLAGQECAGICEFTPADFTAQFTPDEFLARFSERYYLFDASLRRDQAVPIKNEFKKVSDEIKSREKPWTDILFYPKALGENFVDWR